MRFSESPRAMAARPLEACSMLRSVDPFISRFIMRPMPPALETAALTTFVPSAVMAHSAPAASS